MKELIEYNYNVEINEVTDEDNVTSFYYNNNLYIFVKCIRNIEELDDVMRCNEELIKKNIKTSQIMLNKHNKFYTLIGEDNYVMIKVLSDYKSEVDIIKMIENNKKTNLNTEAKSNYKNLWGKLWSDKIDYFEYQVSQLAKDKEVILESFSYYVGLAENAISIVNNMNKENNFGKSASICLCHRRIFNPNYNLNYYNPLSYIFDLEVRDIAEYIKSTFYKVGFNDAILDLITCIKLMKLSNYEYNMLYARLLYPSQYFDIYEKILLEEESENSLIEIIKSAEEYEMFLKKVYYEISRFTKIENINWITDVVN